MVVESVCFLKELTDVSNETVDSCAMEPANMWTAFFRTGCDDCVASTEQQCWSYISCYTVAERKLIFDMETIKTEPLIVILIRF